MSVTVAALISRSQNGGERNRSTSPVFRSVDALYLEPSPIGIYL